MISNEEIIKRVVKGVELLQDKTYDPVDLQNHLLQIITDVREEGKVHKNHLERFIYKFEPFSKELRLYFGGHKTKKTKCKNLLDELDIKYQYLLTHSGYSIERFKEKEKTETGKLFE